MAPKIQNLSDEIDDNESWKTYYIRIRCCGEFYYKFGICKKSVKHRFKKEGGHIDIDILKIWKHGTEYEACRHERSLFDQYTGDMPYIGRCGPLQFGGNTETYSHDVMGGEPEPQSYIAKLVTLQRAHRLAVGYVKRNPLLTYKHLFGEVRYMDSMWGPPDCGEDVFLQVPSLSSPTHVVLATVAYLEDGLLPERPSQRWFSKKLIRETLEQNITVRSWYDYTHMKFWGTGFNVSKWDEWW